MVSLQALQRMTDTHPNSSKNRILPDRIETARFTLMRFQPDDLDDLYLLYGDANVMAIRKIGVQNRDQTAEQLHLICRSWQQLGLGLYAVRDGSTGRFLGECGLRPDSSDPEDGIALSYGLVPEAWGRGFATETSARVLAAGFGNLALDMILAFAKSDHPASLRVLDKLEFVRVPPRTGQPGGVVRSDLERSNWVSLHGTPK